ncbi:MAG: transglutaminase family protein [Armatimonadota bacterium]|nr:transglutaminase family protein [Armatimonadota bacterium]
MFYAIRHITKFRYNQAITESSMELRMKPQSEGNQVCGSFELALSPLARAMSYRDYLGNTIHHFNLLRRHSQLTISTKAAVEVNPLPPLPDAISCQAWKALDVAARDSDYWEWLGPSAFARPTEKLIQLGKELELGRDDNPLAVLNRLASGIHTTFSYSPKTTRADSPIDEALSSRQGVCQGFSHIMIALARSLGIPSRYVSGYLFSQSEAGDGGDRTSADATHAWVESWLPELGWVGFDPTNNLIVSDRHIRVAIGRDYADVPPTRGVYHGNAKGELSVAVQVRPLDAMPSTLVDQEDVPEEIWREQSLVAAMATAGSGTDEHQHPLQQQQVGGW